MHFLTRRADFFLGGSVDRCGGAWEEEGETKGRDRHRVYGLMSHTMMPTREVPLRRAESCLLVVDLQNECVHPRGGTWAAQEAPAYFRERIPEVIGNAAALIAAGRAAGDDGGGVPTVERAFTVIESLTHNGRDRSLDYKISGFNVGRGSWGASMPACIAPKTDAGPGSDELVFPKCSSSVFISTNIAYKVCRCHVQCHTIDGRWRTGAAV